MLGAGKRDKRITIEKATDTQDETTGAATITWSEFWKCWAAINTIGGTEKVRADQVEAGLTHKITILYKSGITPKMRVDYKGRKLGIESIVNTDEANVELVLNCKEKVS